MKTMSEVYNHGADFAEDQNKLKRLETALNNYVSKLRAKGVPVIVESNTFEKDEYKTTVAVYVPTDFYSPKSN